jgi:mediator of RNA polymerase II transcription subunit 6
MPPPHPPPDELEFDAPQSIGSLPVPGLHSANNLLWYFTSSPWFDPNCNNIAVWNAVRLHDPATCEHIMNDRKLWQERLDAMPHGTQYVLAGEGQGEGHPWLLQRQNKVEVPGEKEEEESHVETFVEGNYYTHGTRMLMAPSLLDVVQSRLVRRDIRMVFGSKR